MPGTTREQLIVVLRPRLGHLNQAADTAAIRAPGGTEHRRSTEPVESTDPKDVCRVRVGEGIGQQPLITRGQCEGGGRAELRLDARDQDPLDVGVRLQLPT
jgi:hypothetical protein